MAVFAVRNAIDVDVGPYTFGRSAAWRRKCHLRVDFQIRTVPTRVVHPWVKSQNMSNVNVRYNVTPRAFKFDNVIFDRNLTDLTRI